MPLSQTFTKPISIHYGSPCFLNRFRITFCPFQEGSLGPHSFPRIFYSFGATCMAFYVIALMGNSCYVKSEILLNYREAGYGNWHYVKTLQHHFISRHIWATYSSTRQTKGRLYVSWNQKWPKGTLRQKKTWLKFISASISINQAQSALTRINQHIVTPIALILFKGLRMTILALIESMHYAKVVTGRWK